MGSIIVNMVLIVLAILLIVYLWYQKRFRYWKNRKVPSLKYSFPFGNLKGVGTEIALLDAFQNMYNEGDGHSFVGVMLLFAPGVLIRDPDLIKAVLVKDFSSFNDHGIYACEENDPLAGILLYLTTNSSCGLKLTMILAHTLFHKNGADWKRLRNQMTPVFTSGSIKNMVPLILECGQALVKAVEKCFTNGEELDVKEVAARYTTDVIMSCAFGIQTRTLSGEDEEFRVMGMKVFEPSFELAWRNVISFIVPKFAAFVKLRVTARSVTNFFLGCFKDMVEYRLSNNVHRKDVLQLLIQLMEKGIITDGESKDGSADVKKLTLTEAASQAYIFFIAGFESSSSTIQFALYELSMRPDLQEKLVEEIKRVKEVHGPELTYTALKEMEFLEKVVAETLRKYPIIPLIRNCNKDYQIPGTDIIIEEGTRILIPTSCIQNDPKYFPEPEKFDPERFNKEEIEKRHPFVYLPFGKGPRHCIGGRFGYVQIKIALVSILSKFRVDLSPKTPVPLTYDPRSSSVVTPKESIYLKLSLRD